MLLFDIVFKSGEFYGDEGSFWKDYIMPVFTAALGAGIGAYVTYRVFRETLIENRKTEARQRLKEQESELRIKNDLENERLLYLHHLVSNSIKFTEFFRDSLNKFYSDFEKDEMIVPQLDQMISNDLQRITYNIDREGHFHAYRVHVKKQGILKFYGSLDYIEQVRTQIFDSLGKAKTFDYERKEKLRDRLEELTMHCQLYLQSCKLGEVNNVEERKTVNALVIKKVEITTNKQTDYQSLVDNFVKPLIQFFVQNDINDLSPAFREIGNMASVINKLPSEIKANNRRIAESFKVYANDILPVLKHLKEEFKDLDEYCNRTFPDQS